MSITAARLQVDVDANTKAAESKLGAFGAAMGAPVRGFSAMKGAAVAFGGAAVVAMAGKTIMAASDYNEEISKTAVVFGKGTPALKAVTDNVNKLANAYGLNRTESMKAASGFGLLGTAAGITGPPLAKLSNGLTGLAADAASFYNVPMSQALDDFHSGLVGEAEPLRKYGVLLNETTVGHEAVRLGLSKTGKDLTEGMKVQARASLITSGLSKANGDLARTSGSVANRLREIAGRASNAAISLGTFFLPAAEAVLGGAIRLTGAIGGLAREGFGIVMKVLQPFIGLLRQAFDGFKYGGDAVSTITDLIDGMLGRFSPGGATIGGFIKQIIGGFNTAKDAVQQFARQVTAFVTGSDFQGALGRLGAAFVSLSPIVGQLRGILASIVNTVLANRTAFLILAGVIGLVIAPIPVLIAMIVAAYARFETFRNVVNGVVTFLIGTFLPGVIRVVGAFEQRWLGAVTGVIQFAGSIVGVLSTFVGWVVAKIGGFTAWLVPTFRMAWQILGPIVRITLALITANVVNAFNVVRGIITVTMAVIRGVFTVAWAAMRIVVQAAWTVISSVVGGAVRIIGGVITVFLSLLTGNWSRAWSGVRAILSGAWQAISGIVRAGVGIVTGIVRGLIPAAAGALSGVGGALVSAGRNLISGFISGIRDMIGTVKDTLGDLTSKLTSWKGPPGKDATLLRGAGQLVMRGFLNGLEGQYGAIRQSLGSFTGSLTPSMGGMGLPKIAGGLSGGMAGPDSTNAFRAVGALGGSKLTSVTINQYNPRAEPTSVSTNRALQTVRVLGL